MSAWSSRKAATCSGPELESAVTHSVSRPSGEVPSNWSWLVDEGLSGRVSPLLTEVTSWPPPR